MYSTSLPFFLPYDMRKNSQNECNVGGGLTGVSATFPTRKINVPRPIISITTCQAIHYVTIDMLGLGLAADSEKKKDLIIMKQKTTVFLTFEKK